MEFKVPKNIFLKAVNIVGNISHAKNNTVPILGNVLIETEKGNKLTFKGTDLEIGLSCTVEAEIEAEGSITIPARKLLEIARELPDGQVEVTVAKNNAVNIKSGKSFFKLMGLSKEDYPKLPEFSLDKAVEVDQATLKEGFSLTSFAISYDETRYVLNGVLFSLSEGNMRFVATDGRRLAFIHKKDPENKSQKLEMIVPAKTVGELQKILSWEGKVKVIQTQNQVIFHLGDIYLVSRLIEGNFPNYEQVIPKQEKTFTNANREALLQAVKRTSVLTSLESPAVKLDFVKGKILISSRSPNLGEAKEELMADVNGEEVAVGFNPNYLIDVLKNLDVDEISISLSDPDKPGLLKAKDGYLYVIMPMQIN